MDHLTSSGIALKTSMAGVLTQKSAPSLLPIFRNKPTLSRQRLRINMLRFLGHTRMIAQLLLLSTIFKSKQRLEFTLKRLFTAMEHIQQSSSPDTATSQSKFLEQLHTSYSSRTLFTPELNQETQSDGRLASQTRTPSTPPFK